MQILIDSVCRVGLGALLTEWLTFVAFFSSIKVRKDDSRGGVLKGHFVNAFKTIYSVLALHFGS